MTNWLIQRGTGQSAAIRTLYENLSSEVAPGHIKSVLAFIAFERRQNNNEKVKDLFFKAF